VLVVADPVADPDLLRRVQERRWYHTIDLASGVTTPGFFDHRRVVERYELPASLAGLRALDVGTFDGFWAFEMERRGAEVVALDVDTPADLDWPPRLRESGLRGEGANADLLAERGFEVAHAALGSSVRRETVSVYDATPERFGTFDLVFCGSVLVHLRDPLLALERMAALCHGRFVLAENYSRRLGLLPMPLAQFTGEGEWLTWWRPSSRGWCAMARCAGFDEVRRGARLRLDIRDSAKGIPHVVVHGRGTAARREP
jgi:tRNA (mo5U34)-methyltransferase